VCVYVCVCVTVLSAGVKVVRVNREPAAGANCPAAMAPESSPRNPSKALK